MAQLVKALVSYPNEKSEDREFEPRREHFFDPSLNYGCVVSKIIPNRQLLDVFEEILSPTERLGL